MHKRRWKRQWLGLVFGLLFGGVIQAAPITIQLSGLITQVPIDDLYGDIVAGSLVQISYTFDSAAVDQIPGDPSSGSYLSAGPPFVMSFTLPGHVFTAGDSVQIGILNSIVDQYTVLAFGSGGSDTLEIFLQDNNGAVFSTDSLLLTMPSLTNFTLTEFHVHVITDRGETQFDGQISSATEAVPEPAPVLMLVIGLTASLALARSTRKDGSRAEETA